MRSIEHIASHSHGAVLLMGRADNNKKIGRSDDFKCIRKTKQGNGRSSWVGSSRIISYRRVDICDSTVAEGYLGILMDSELGPSLSRQLLLF